MVALDTGFFVAFMKGSEDAKSLWHKIKENKIKPIVSILTIGELLYILYREGRSKEIDIIIKRMVSTTEIINTDIEIIRKGAEIKHLQKIPYIDSLIGATAIVNGCKKLYTSDRKHMKNLQDYGIEIVFLRE